MVETDTAGAHPDPHLDEQLILDWLDQRLGAKDKARAERHIHGCAECRHLVAAIAQAVDEEAPVQGPDSVIGTSLGPYRAVAQLGVGAMGWVFRGWDPRLGRAVAIKIVRHRDVSVQQIREEGRALARVNHPNVVTVLATGGSAVGPWLAMELVDGSTLPGWVEQSEPSMAERVAALRSAARGLAAVHGAAVIHGDFKPTNVLVGHDRRVRVADFGLARVRAAASKAGAETQATSGGEPSEGPGGTPAYMAPEVLRGAMPTPHSDQFSFCVTAWELLTGERPFGGSTIAALVAAIEARALRKPNRALPGRWARVLRRGLESSPDRRFPTMDALVAELDKPSRPRVSVALGAFAVIAGVAAVSLAPEGRCEDEMRSADAVASVVATVGAEATEDSDAESPRAWLSSWKMLRQEVCDAPTPFAGNCLDAALAQVEGRLAAVTDGTLEAQVVLRGVAAPSDCLDAPQPRTLLQTGPALRLDRDLQRTRARYAHTPSERARRAYAALTDRADALGDVRLQAKTRLTQAQTLDWLGYREAARAMFERAYFYALDAGSPDLGVVTATSLAQNYADGLSRLEPALVWLGHARALLPKCRDTTRRPRLEMIHAEILHSFGRLDEAAAHLDAALGALDEDAPTRLRATIYGTLGNLTVSQGNYEDAIEHFREAIALHESRGIRGSTDLPRAINGMAGAHTYLGRYDEALALWERMRAMLESRDAPPMEFATLDGNMGVLYMMVDDLDAALRHFELAAVAAAEAYGGVGPVLAKAHQGQAAVHAQREKWSESAEAARAGVAAAMAVQPPALDLAVESLQLLGQALVELGEPAAAVSAHRRRVRALEELVLRDGRPWGGALAVARVDLAEVLVGAENESARRAEVQRAREWLDAHPDGLSEAERAEVLRRIGAAGGAD